LGWHNRLRPGALLRLDVCELPCWIGIEPGKTTLEESRRYIEAAYQDQALYQLEAQDVRQYGLTYLPTGYRFGVSIESRNFEVTLRSIVQRIYIQPLVTRTFPFERPRIAELYSSLGNAEGVQRLSGINITSLAVLFRNRLVEIYFDEPECDRVNPEQPVRSILISHRSNEVNVAWLSAPIPWRGFQRYHDLELRNYP
jgi:hypothetical protein